MAQRHEVRIEQRMEVECEPEKLFEMLMDPAQSPHFAAGIEGAQIIEDGPDGGLVGSRIELITRSGNTLMATVNRLEVPRLIELEDERGLKSTWTVEKADKGCVIVNLLEGKLTEPSARALAYDADLKFQGLSRAFKEGDPDLHKGLGHSGITGTPRTPKGPDAS
jgi:ribosome-associated toxin RatA of RatAB toxin-antitoxin module